MKLRSLFIFGLILILVFSLFACQPRPPLSIESTKPQVLATTTIVADVVSQVSGDLIDLSVLLQVGADPHSFSPTPQDIARVADASIIFSNGVGLEAFLENLIESAGAQDRVVSVSEGIRFLEITSDHSDEHGDEPDLQPNFDPHVWTDPQNVMVWVQNIERELSQVDPDHAEIYQQNATNYLAELAALDIWIQEQVNLIPEYNKKIVTDHAIFGYYGVAYGFQQVGALIPGYSTLSEPSAQDLARIEDAIRDFQVKAIFVGKNINPALAAQVAEDTGTRLITVYTGSLSEPGEEADTYLAYMRYNTTAFLEGLK